MRQLCLTVGGKPPPARAWIALFISSETERGNRIEGLIASRNFNFNSIFCKKIYARRPLASTSTLLQSPWPRLRVKRGSFGGSSDRSGLLPDSTLALLPTG
jgi:hypothetical protein